MQLESGVRNGVFGLRPTNAPGERGKVFHTGSWFSDICANLIASIKFPVDHNSSFGLFVIQLSSKKVIGSHHAVCRIRNILSRVKVNDIVRL